MYAISDAFREAIQARNAKPITYVDAYIGNSLVQSKLMIEDGKVTVDGSAAIRRRLDLRIIDLKGLFNSTDPQVSLIIYGYTLRAWQGYRYIDGTEEVVPIGTFKIVSAKLSENSQSVDITGQDFAYVVQRARFEAAFAIPSGTNHVDAINMILQAQYGSTVAQPNIPITSTTGMLVYNPGDDPWKACQDIAQAVNCDLFFDMTGTLKLNNRTGPKSLVFTYDVGDDNTTMLSLDTDLTNDKIYNAVIVVGEPQNAAPVRATAYDLNTASPTYYNGPFGKVPKFYSSPFIYTQAQAQQVANSMLRSSKISGERKLRLSVVPNPAYEIGDQVRIIGPNLEINNVFAIDSFTLPFKAQSMDLDASRTDSVAA